MKRLWKYIVIVRVSFANAIAYRASLVSRFAFYTMFIYVFMGLWKAIYSEGSVNGYGYVQMVWYLIMTEFISFACGTGVFRTMNDDVKSGAIAYQLSRPLHYVFYQLANSLGGVLLNMICFAPLAIALGLLLVGPLPTLTLAGIAPLALSVTLGFVLNYFFLMLIGLSAFVMEENFAFYLIYQKLNFMLGMFLPVEFLPPGLQTVARNMPFSYVYWAPAKIFVGYTPELFRELIPRQAAWALVSFAMAMLAYSISARRLQVNGG